MDCKISGGTGFIKHVEWLAIPQLAVLMGKNGAGKTKVLSLLATHHQANVFNEGGCSVELSETFAQSDVLHYSSLWPVQVVAGAASEEVIEQIRVLATGVQPNGMPVGGALGSDPFREELLSQIAADQEVEVAELTRQGVEGFQRFVTPSALTRYRDGRAAQVSLAFYFLAYQMLARLWELDGKSSDFITQRIGVPPWRVLNRIFEAAELPYEVEEPHVPSLAHAGYFNRTTYTFRLRDVSSNASIQLDGLSAGERVLVGMAMWMFNIQHGGQTPKLLLLDEPDAHLHPRMVRQFLKVLQDVFVEEAGMRVIMTTHSPTTVAMAPDDSIFELRRAAPLIEKISKPNAIGSLTEGLIVVSERWPLVMCEGPHDPDFYRAALEKSLAAASKEEMLGHMAFMHGCGVQTVQAVVPASRAEGMKHMVGVIDADFKRGERSTGRVGNDGVVVLRRGAIENYLFDPLVIWFAHRSDSRNMNGVRDQSVPRGAHARLDRVARDVLQGIAEDVLGCLHDALEPGVERSIRKVNVKFLEGLELQYPEWILYEHKDALLTAASKAFDLLQNNPRRRLQTAFAAIALTPVDLHEVLREAHELAMRT